MKGFLFTLGGCFTLAFMGFVGGMLAGALAKAERTTYEVCKTMPDGIPVANEPEIVAPKQHVKSLHTIKTPTPSLNLSPPDMATIKAGDVAYFASGEAERVLSVTPYQECWAVETATTVDCYARGGASESGNRIMGVVR